jgi:hypothetical protein
MRGLRHTIGYIAYDGGDVMSNEEQKKLIDRVTRKHRAGELAVDFRIAAADGIPFGEESGTVDVKEINNLIFSTLRRRGRTRVVRRA